MPNPDVVTITRRGGTDPITLSVTGASCSWEISAAGIFSAFAHTDAVGDIRGRWLRWDHLTAGPWGGIVTSLSRSGSEVEIGATGFASLTRGRVSRRAIATQAASPGGLFRRILSEMTREEPSYLTLGQADELGAPIALSLSAGDTYDDVIAQIADASLMEWRVDANRRVEFAQTIGVDRTASVALYEGVHVLDYRRVDDYWSIANRLVGFGSEPESEAGGGRQEGATVGDAASLRTYGPVESSRTYLDTRSALAIAPRLKRELTRTANPPAIVDVTMVDRGGIFARFREGDAVTLVIGSAHFRGAFRPMVRAIDEDGVMVLSGEVAA